MQRGEYRSKSSDFYFSEVIQLLSSPSNFSQYKTLSYIVRSFVAIENALEDRRTQMMVKEATYALHESGILERKERKTKFGTEPAFRINPKVLQSI